ncbi:MAG: T9SS type A sorting domain-containing protein [Bacteroidia bacterium]
MGRPHNGIHHDRRPGVQNHGFSLANAIDPLVIEECQVLAFIYDQTTEEIITGVEVQAKNGTTREATTAIDGLRNDISLSMYPNPVQDVATLRFNASGTAVSMQVFDMLGNKVAEQSAQAQPGTNVVRISSIELGLTAGSYFLRVEDGEKAGVVKMLVK